MVEAILIAAGLCTMYSPGVAEKTFENRIRWNEVDPSIDVAGYVALLLPDTIGDTVYLELPDGRITGPLLVIDCAQSNHRESLIERKWAVDIDYKTWQQLELPIRPIDNCKIWSSLPVSTSIY